MIRHIARHRGLLHQTFELSLLAKALFALAETAAGIGMWLTPPAAIQRLIGWFLTTDLVEGRHGPAARALTTLAQRFDANAQHFFAWYLLLHGVIKLVVIVGLQRRVSIAYPLAIAIFAGFIIYQMQQWAVTGSPVMLALSAFDLLVIALTWHEWRGA